MADIRAENISHINGNVNVAGRDIINNIQAIERDLTPAEVREKNLQAEVNELEHCVREYLRRLKQQIRTARSSAPYKKLEAFTFSEAEIFFGRNQAISDLYNAMKRGRLTVLQGESGAGKSSLLHAGIMPRILADKNLAVIVRPVYENPTQTIKKAFVGDLELTPILRQAPLLDFLRRVKQIIGHGKTLYLILDQFEEFFSKHTLEVDRQAFTADLSACLDDRTLNVRWVIALTTEAFGQLGKFKLHIQNPFSNEQSLYLFTRAEAEEVIAKPAERHGISFEEGLLKQLLDDLARNHEDKIAPTQIQLVCAALYDDINDQGALITRQLYNQNGGAQGILQDYIEGVLQRTLPSEERAAAYKILEALVTSEKKRVMRARRDLEDTLGKKGVSLETVESTLDHLVDSRLLRRLGDDPEHTQYEIVHDYLLGEIEINEGVRKAKEAEELLEQGVGNWEKQKLLLAPDALKVVESRAPDISISSAAARLLFLSAVEYRRPAEQWLKMISPEDQKDLSVSLLSQKSNPSKREALWYLREHLSKPQRAKVAAGRSSRTLWVSLRTAVLLILLAVAVLIVGRIILGETEAFVPWTQVTSFSSQCLNGSVPSSLLVAIDADDASRVVAYDSQSGKLCETPNSGVRWESIANTLPPELVINAIAVHSQVFLATDRGIYFTNGDSDWQRLEAATQESPPVQEIAVSSDGERVYAVTEQGSVYTYETGTGQFEPVQLDGITGDIRDLTLNYDYLAISTSDGVWYRGLDPETAWTKADFIATEQPIFTSIQLVYPVKSWRHFFDDPTDDDWFLAATEKGELYRGFLTDTRSLQEVSASPSGIASLAVNGFSKFSAGPDGLYCEQTWNLLDAEWWLRFGWAKPCT